MNRVARREDLNWPTHCELCGRRLGKFGEQWAFVAGNALCANGHLPLKLEQSGSPASSAA